MIKNYLSIIIIAILVGLITIPQQSFASTPDGETPAQESVCNGLKTDGVTKGLYGLCVAFCEAHDAASLSTQVTVEELAELFEATPSGKILERYNQKRSETDPTMPCINVNEGQCSCWNSEQITALDGVVNSSELMPPSSEEFHCSSISTENGNSLILRELDNTNQYTSLAAVNENAGIYKCSFANNTPEIVANNQSINISQQEYLGCKTEIEKQVEQMGLTCNAL